MMYFPGHTASLYMYIYALVGQTAAHHLFLCPGQGSGGSDSGLWGLACVKSAGQCCPLWFQDPEPIALELHLLLVP